MVNPMKGHIPYLHLLPLVIDRVLNSCANAVLIDIVFALGLFYIAQKSGLVGKLYEDTFTYRAHRHRQPRMFWVLWELISSTFLVHICSVGTYVLAIGESKEVSEV